MLELIEDIKQIGIPPERMVVVMCRSESPAQAALTVAAVKKTGVPIIPTAIVSLRAAWIECAASSPSVRGHIARR
jgi:hypothetical protein